MKGIGKDYEKLKELILIEEFKKNLSELKLYMEERRIEKVWISPVDRCDDTLMYKKKEYN